MDGEEALASVEGTAAASITQGGVGRQTAPSPSLPHPIPGTSDTAAAMLPGARLRRLRLAAMRGMCDTALCTNSGTCDTAHGTNSAAPSSSASPAPGGGSGCSRASSDPSSRCGVAAAASPGTVAVGSVTLVPPPLLLDARLEGADSEGRCCRGCLSAAATALEGLGFDAAGTAVLALSTEGPAAAASDCCLPSCSFHEPPAAEGVRTGPSLRATMVGLALMRARAASTYSPASGKTSVACCSTSNSSSRVFLEGKVGVRETMSVQENKDKQLQQQLQE